MARFYIRNFNDRPRPRIAFGHASAKFALQWPFRLKMNRKQRAKARRGQQ